MTGEPRRRRRPTANASSRHHLLLALPSFVIGLGIILAPRSGVAASVRSVTVTPSPIQLQIGQAQVMRAVANFSDGTTQDITQVAEWTTGSSRIAIVSATPGSIGIVTAIGPGTVKISAAITIDDDKTKGSADITVVAPPLQAITTKPTTKKLEIGVNSQFKATGLYANEFTADITTQVEWTSTNPAVATVDNVAPTKGLVRPRAIGTTTIIARHVASGVTNTDGATQVRSAITSLSVEPRDVNLARRMRFPLRCYGHRDDGTRSNISSDVSWGSTNRSVVSVGQGETEGGVLQTFANSGTATIHCIDDERNLSTVESGMGATVNVAGRLIGLEVRPVTLTVGEEKGAHVFGLLHDGTKTSDLVDVVAWSIAGPAVATVGNADADRGDVVGVTPGTTTLVAYEPSSQLTSPQTGNLKVLGALQSVAMETGEGLVGTAEIVEFKARATYQGGETSNVSDKCTWTSDRQRIASVSDVSPNKGLVSGLKKGRTVIRAVCEGRSISGDIEVLGALTGIEVSPATFEDETLVEKKFRANGLYDDGSTRDLNKEVDWSSSSPGVVKIDNEDDPGLATLLTPGSATITARHPTRGFVATATVVVEPGVLSMQIVPDERTIRGSVLARFRAQGRRADGTTKVVTKKAVWSSDDPQIARASNREGEKGTIFGGGKEGTTLIRARLADGFEATARVTVQGLLTHFELIPETRTIPYLEARIVEARGHFTDGSETKITRGVVYTSSKPTVVVVSNEPGSQGVMTAVGHGTATVSAFDPSSGKSAVNVVQVTVP